MPDVLNPQAADAVNFTNVKNVGELHALTAGLSGQNQLAQQQRVNELANNVMASAMQSGQQLAQLAGQQALQISQNAALLSQVITGRVSRFILDTSAEEAVSFEKQIGSALADRMTNIEAALATGQQSGKTAETTPPQTGTGGAFGSDAGNALLQQLANIQALLQSLIDKKPA